MVPRKPNADRSLKHISLPDIQKGAPRRMVAVFSVISGVRPIIWCSRMLSRLFIGLLLLFRAAAASKQEVLASTEVCELPEQDDINQARTELHVVTLETKDNANAIRRNDERSQLLQRLVRSKGCTDKNHPRARLLIALHGFSRYEDRNKAELKRWKDNYGHVPQHQKKILERAVGYSDKLSTTDKLIQKNNELCNQIVTATLDFYGVSRTELDEYIRTVEATGAVAERVSVNQALKHYVRDWSAEGEHERKTFPCILNTITQYSARIERSEDQPLKVLVPGAGLARLGYEIDALGGFEVTLNEWSMYMNLAYRFLETLSSPQSHSYHPFIDSFSHHATTGDQQRAVIFPDVHIDSSSIVMVEGDFSTAFASSKNHFDFVVTHFFIDTARNLMNYFETIRDVLKTGGHWVNSGPLLYGTGPWVQLSLEEIIDVAKDMGFEFMELDAECGELTFPDEKVRWMASIYGSNERALHMNGYRVQSWIAKKL